MAGQSLEFTISASDQASKVVTTVQKKIDNFGKDVGRSIAGVLGPMALVGFAVSKVTDYLAEMEKKAKEAFDFGTGLEDAGAKLGVTAEQFQHITQAAKETGSSVNDLAKALVLANDLIEKGKSGNQSSIEKLDALGISVKDLEKTKPEDVLAKLAGAMAAAQDPTEKMAIAMAILGKDAGALQKVLEKGFDIAGAFKSKDVITNEEAALLAEAKAIKDAEDLKEKLRLAREAVEPAREAARQRFMQSPEGAEFSKRFTPTSSALTGTVTGGASNAAIDAEIKRLADKKIADAKKAAEDAARNAANIEARNKALELSAIQTEEAKKKPETEKAERTVKGSRLGTQSDAELGSISVKSAPIMVSSLREIGGGMAGEKIASQIDLQTIQVDLTRSMLTELQSLNNKSRDTVDFTKLPIQGGVSNFTKTLA